jgi:putative copper export protein
MKKRTKVILIIIAALLIVLFLGMSVFTGLQVFAASTQLVTNDQTRGISESTLVEYGID